jgi:hypothetical protein
VQSCSGPLRRRKGPSVNPEEVTAAVRRQAQLGRQLDELTETQQWVHHIADLDRGEVLTNILDRPVTPLSRIERLSRLGPFDDPSVFNGPSFRLTPQMPYQASRLRCFPSGIPHRRRASIVFRRTGRDHVGAATPTADGPLSRHALLLRRIAAWAFGGQPFPEGQSLARDHRARPRACALCTGPGSGTDRRDLRCPFSRRHILPRQRLAHRSSDVN